MKNNPLKIFDLTIQPGERVTLALPTPEFYTCVPMHIPIHVVHGKKAGPTLVVCGAIHGDETNGVVIVQRLLELNLLKKLSGTLIAVPVVNIFGLIEQSRNLPDGRDLEKNFPGKQEGSFAARLAYLFNKEILQKADVCIDLHTGEPHTKKLSQIHTNFNIEKTKELADAFGAPVILHHHQKRGLLFLMQEDQEKKIPTLLFEAGEALRLDEIVIRTGIRGIVNIFKNLQMLKSSHKQKPNNHVKIYETHWVHSPGSGICNLYKKLGSFVKKSDLLAKISDPFGTKQTYDVISPMEGIIIAQNNLPLVNEGESILQIAKQEESQTMPSQISSLEQEIDNQ
ncbi:MAG: succinylglutamate desuccinylase/aspartoacylase family protein [Parachlamydiales bacterium]|nr:succinylglutamate desuccinylase/aspartoacylase family protein [Parachlamydiales bacterium]